MSKMAEVVSPIDADLSPEDIEARALMEKWGSELDVESSNGEDMDDDLKDYDDELEKYRREVNAGDNELDHIVLATSDLDKGIEIFEQMTGMKPVMVVSLNGLGTKSARVAFENACFLEIIAPDPKQTNRPLGDKLVNLDSGKLVPFHYAVRHSKLNQLKESQFADLGFECDQVTMVAKDRGMPWKWDIVFLEGHSDGGLVPMYVNWSDSHHASGRLPIVGSLESVRVTASGDSAIHKLLDDVDGVETQTGPNNFEFSIKSKKGLHTFSGSSLIGVSFPKEGGLPVKTLDV